jgi:hypothetical protein
MDAAVKCYYIEHQVIYGAHTGEHLHVLLRDSMDILLHRRSDHSISETMCRWIDALHHQSLPAASCVVMCATDDVQLSRHLE